MFNSKILQTFNYRSSYMRYRPITISSEEINKNNEEIEPRIKTWKDIPGPASLPFIGPLHNFLPGGQFYNVDRRQFANSLHEIYGPIVKLDKLLNQPDMIFLFDADSAGMVLRGENWLPHRPTIKSVEAYRTKYSDNKLQSLVISQGMEWKNFRSKVSHIMLDFKSIAAAHTTQLNEVAMDLIGRLKNRQKKNLIIQDFEADMKLWALDATAIVNLGHRLNSFNSNLPENSPEKQLIALNQKFFETSENIDFKPNAWQYFYFGQFRTAMQILSDIDRLTQFYISKARERFAMQERKADEEKSILEKLLESDEITALSMGTDSLIAGVDTISNAAISLLYCLGVNADKQDLLREEISSGNLRGPYLRACMKESLRIIPPVFLNARVITKPYNILGFKIPAGIRILFMHEYMGKMESNFPRPNEFIPERWLVDKNHPLYYGNASPFASSPFGFGARACIGRRIAELTIETLVAKMVEHFDIGWEGPPPELLISTTTYMKPPLKFVLNDIN